MTLSLPLAILVLVALQRLGELVYARRNTQRLREQGAEEVGAGHYPVIVAVHAGWLATLFAYIPPDAPIFWPPLALYGLLQLGRIWTIAALGPHWTTRILVLPGAEKVQRGPYRWLKHPNYWIVALEIPTLPLIFGAWPISLVFGMANIAVLAWRIRVENRALAKMM